MERGIDLKIISVIYCDAYLFKDIVYFKIRVSVKLIEVLCTNNVLRLICDIIRVKFAITFNTYCIQITHWNQNFNNSE